MTVINSNSAALRAQNASRLASRDLSQAMGRLASGNRINSASDDAAGLAISSSMTSQITGMNQAIRNANDGISLIQTADDTMDEITSMFQRIRELAVQSASGTYSDDDRTNMQAELSELTGQINNSLYGETFNGIKLFDTSGSLLIDDELHPFIGSGTKISVQTGPDANENLDLEIPGIPMSFFRIIWNNNLTKPAETYDTTQSHLITIDDFTAGAEVGSRSVQIDDIGKSVSQEPGDSWYNEGEYNGPYPRYGTSVPFAVSDELNVTNPYRTSNTIHRVDQLLSTIDTVRADLGASESRLNSVVNSLTNGMTNLTDARSRIADTDFSSETTALTKAQIINQAATAMLAQANQTPQQVLKLLQQ